MRGLGVERGGRLVGEQQRGVGGQGARDADALLLATRELLGVVLAALGQAHKVEQFVHAAFALLLIDARELQGVLNIASSGTRIEEVELLEDHANIAANAAELALGLADDVGAVEKQLPARGGIEAVDEANQRGLTGTRVADDAEDFTRLDGERDAVDGGDFAVAGFEDLGNVPELDPGAGGGHYLYSSTSSSRILFRSSLERWTCTAVPLESSLSASVTSADCQISTSFS